MFQLIYEYSLIKNKLFSYEKLEHEARTLLDTHIRKYSISNEHFVSIFVTLIRLFSITFSMQLTERDFQAIQNLCNDLNQSNIFFKNGLSDSHPQIGVLMVPSANSGVEKSFIFIKNLPYKMHIRVGITGLHKILALLVILYDILTFTRLEHAAKEKENALQQRDDMESKLKDLTQQNRSLQEKLAEAIDQLQQQHDHVHTTIDHTHDTNSNQFEHEQMHRTINQLIEQAAVKTRTAVEDVRQQYNDNLERIMEEYNNMEAALNQKQIEFDKCLRAKRSVEDELEKILQERRLNLEKSALDNEDLAKRCFQSERERDESQLKFEQNQQAFKMLQQSYEADKKNHEHKQKELTERLQKVSNDLDKMTLDYTATFNELNELKKRLSSTQNEQTLLQRRMAELVKRHEEQIIEKEKECLVRLTQRDDVNRVTFNELRNLVNRQQRMIVKYKEECHTIASQSETTINGLKQKIDNLRSRNEQLQSEIGDVKRKDAEMDRILTKNANRIKALEERLHDAEEQAIEASRRVAKQLVRDRLAITQGDHYSYSTTRPNHSTSLFNLTALRPQIVPSTTITDSIEHLNDEK
ncbi:unnamed protein product [Rotaria sp. Silwood2]|nr:unnamed protein product [Rotaria sp. Silwood2]